MGVGSPRGCPDRVGPGALRPDAGRRWVGVGLQVFVRLLVCRIRIAYGEYGLMVCHRQVGTGNGDILVFRPMRRAERSPRPENQNVPISEVAIIPPPSGTPESHT